MVSDDNPARDQGDLDYERCAALHSAIPELFEWPAELSIKSAYGLKAANCTIVTGKTIFVCNKGWLAVLLVTSLVMLSSAVASAILDVRRQSPDLLDGFCLALRDNRYADLPVGCSLEDGTDMARRLRDVKVGMGDVRPEADVGHVAIAVPSEEQPVECLRRGRDYD